MKFSLLCASCLVVTTSALQVPRDVTVETDESPEPHAEPASLTWEEQITRPRMLVSEGCDASRALIRHAHFIMKLHNIGTPWRKIYTLHGAEANIDHFTAGNEGLHDEDAFEEKDEETFPEGENGASVAMAQIHTDPIENPDLEAANQTDNDASEGDVVGRGMVEMHKYFAAQKKALIFKGSFAEAMHSQKSLTELGTRFAALNRKNKIDQLVCMVKDCFNEAELGFPVVNGEKSDLCWKRRFNETAGYKAKLNVDLLHNNLRQLEENVVKATMQFEKMGLSEESVKAVVTEDLLDFEWDEEAVGRAMFAWSHLLRAWGVHPQKGKLEGYLKKNTITRDAPMKHHESIDNFESVKEAIQGLEHFSWMIRE